MKIFFSIFCVMIIAVEASAQLPAYLPANGLVAWYPFTGNANDSSGNNYHGTVSGATLTTDRFGNPNCAYSFDGNTNYISGSCSGYPTTERTVSLWFYTDDIGVGIAGRAFIGYGGGNCGSSWIENVDNYQNGLASAQNTYEVQGHCTVQLLRHNYGATHPNGAWHNWIITTSPAGTSFYIDGALIFSNPLFINGTFVQGKLFVFGSEIGPNGTSVWPKGMDANLTPINGKLDDIGIWNRALTPCEIQQVYTTLVAGTNVTISATGDTHLCGTDSVLLTANTNSTYQWYYNTIPIANATGRSYAARQPGNYTVIAGFPGCQDTSNIITVTTDTAATPSITISAPQTTICSGSLLTFSAAAGPGSGLSYQWKKNRNDVGSNSAFCSDSTLNNNDSISCLVKSSAPCSIPDTALSNTLHITVFTAPFADILTSSSGSLCEGTICNLHTSGSSGNMQWHASLNGADFIIVNQNDTSFSESPAATTYYRVVAENGICYDTSDVIKLIVHPLPVPVLSAPVTLICSSDSARIECSGTFSSYLWNNGDTGSFTYTTNAGGYWVTVTDANGCSAISEHENISVHPVTPISIIVNGDTLSVLNVTSCQWFRNDTLIPNATSILYIAPQTGNYSVQITDNNGCIVRSSEVYVLVNGISHQDENYSLNVYPNPSSDFIIIDAAEKDVRGQIQIADMTGRIIGDFILTTPKHQINTTRFPAGMYLLLIKSMNGYFISKFVKE